jgi:hypothetical protein
MFSAVADSAPFLTATTAPALVLKYFTWPEF